MLFLIQIFSFYIFRLYQVRCSLKVSPGKLPIQLETCIPDQNANTTTTGPCIINGAGASKVFQILYRNEEVSLRDVIMFRAHLLGKLKKLFAFFTFEIIRKWKHSVVVLKENRILMPMLMTVKYIIKSKKEDKNRILESFYHSVAK